MKKAVLGVLLALVASVLALTVNPAPAGAATTEGCTSGKSLRINGWRHKGQYSVPNYVHPVVPKYRDIIFTANMFYLYCPNGDRPDMVKVKGIDWCYTLPDGGDPQFDGVKFNALIFDLREHIVDPKDVTVEDDGGRQGCFFQKIPKRDRRWMWMLYEPQWVAKGTVRMMAWQDTSIKFHDGNSLHHKITPHDDSIVKTGIARPVVAQPAAYIADDPGDCTTGKSLRINPWHQPAAYSVPNYLHPIVPKFDKITLIGEMYYLYCPNGDRPEMVKARKIEWCYTAPDGVHPQFDGVKFAAGITDDRNHSLNLPQVTVPDDGNANCATQTIPVKNRRWLWMIHHPRWQVRAVVKMENWGDTVVHFRAGGDLFREIDPGRDRIIKTGIPRPVILT